MGLLSLFHSRRQPEAKSGEVESGEVEMWQRGTFELAWLSEVAQAVHVRGRTPQIVPAFAVEFALECTEFSPLAEHVAEYAAKHHWDSLQTEALQRMLPALAEGGLFVSTSQLRDRLRSTGLVSPTPPITTLGMPTGGPRLALVERGLRSLAANFQSYERRVKLLVADSSRDPEQTRLLREKLRVLEPELAQPVLLAGAAEKRAFIQHLARCGACAPEVAEFALMDPLETGFACGSNRNTLLLHGAGEMLASVDDDVVCRLSAAPEPADDGVGFYSEHDPYARWLHTERAETLAAARWEERDFLATHEQLLGRDARELAAGKRLHLESAGGRLCERVLREECRVRATFSGHLGDPGIPSSAYCLYYDGENRERLCASAERYPVLLGSRSALCLAPRASLGDATLSPGMALAVDHRTLVPPFIPVLHAEDYSWGAALWQSCPEALLGQVPWAVLHDPPPGKEILAPRELRPGRRAPFFEFAHLLRRLLLAEDPPAGTSTATRLGSIGRRLAELGTLPLADFRDVITEHALREVAVRVQYLTEQLEEETEAPAFWRSDVEHLIAQLTGSLKDSNGDIPLDLQSGRTPEAARVLMQQLLARYGQLLVDWPAMVAATVELRSAGITLGQPVGS